MSYYQVQFKVVQLKDDQWPLAYFYRLKDELGDQLYLKEVIKESSADEWRLTALCTVKSRTEIWIDVVLDCRHWIWIRLRGRGKAPSMEALKKGFEYVNAVAETMDRLNGFDLKVATKQDHMCTTTREVKQ